MEAAIRCAFTLSSRGYRLTRKAASLPFYLKVGKRMPKRAFGWTAYAIDFSIKSKACGLAEGMNSTIQIRGKGWA